MRGMGTGKVGEGGKVVWALEPWVKEDGLPFKDNKESQNSGTGVSYSIIFWEANLGNDVTRLEKQTIAEKM